MVLRADEICITICRIQIHEGRHAFQAECFPANPGVESLLRMGRRRLIELQNEPLYVAQFLVQIITAFALIYVPFVPFDRPILIENFILHILQSEQ